MKVIAIDPGNEKSAVVVYDGETKEVESHSIEDNDDVRELLKYHGFGVHKLHLVVEYTPPYTMQTKTGHAFVPNQVVLTAIELGRFIECYTGTHSLLSRLEIKKHLLGRSSGNDAQITQAILDRYGGTRSTAVGLKATPGPLYGVKKDVWAALAVAITYCEQNPVDDF